MKKSTFREGERPHIDVFLQRGPRQRDVAAIDEIIYAGGARQSTLHPHAPCIHVPTNHLGHPAGQAARL